jgi:putative flippase GtrA
MPLNGRTSRAGNTRRSHAGPLRSAASRQLYRLIPFLVTGFANSIVGFSVIFLCLFAGTSGITANITGYAVALMCSFVLNRHYVFGVRGAISRTEIVRFLAVFIAAYGVNMSVLLLIQPVFGEDSPIAQVLAVAAYTLVFYPLSRVFVFKRESTL